MLEKMFGKKEGEPELPEYKKIAINLIKEIDYSFTEISESDPNIYRIQPLPPIELSDGRITYKSPTEEQLEALRILLVKDYAEHNIDAYVTAESWLTPHIKIEILNESIDEMDIGS